MISVRQSVKYAGRDIQAMSAIATAACKRLLHEFESVLQTHKEELQSDLLIKHHLHLLKEQILESNLVSLISIRNNQFFFMWLDCTRVYVIISLNKLSIVCF